jgi:hypothetical protein
MSHYGALEKAFVCPTPTRNIGPFLCEICRINQPERVFFQNPSTKRVKAGLSISRIKPQPAEIIILDSDDDDAPVVRAKRKAKDYAESSSSDVEVVETDAQSSGKKARTGRGAGFPQQDESLHFAEFGRPKLLIPMEDSAEDGGESSVPPLSADLGVSAFTDGSSSPHFSQRHRRPALRILSKLTTNGVQVTTSSFVRIGANSTTFLN